MSSSNILRLWNDAMGDDEVANLGHGQDVQLLFSSADASNPAFVLAIDNTSQQMHITDVGAKATDWARTAGTHPELAIHSNTTPITDYLAIGNHDGTTATIDVVGGTELSLKLSGTAVMSLQSAGVIHRQRIIHQMPAPETATNTAGLTDAQMLSGVLVGTPTAAAAYTVRTGTQLDAALVAAGVTLAANDAFDLTIINLGATTCTITLTAASGITIVGDPVIGAVADIATTQQPQGIFRLRKTAANTFVAYRIS